MNEFVSRLISRHEYTRECSTTASCTCGGALVNKSRPAVSRRPWLYQMQPYPSRVTTVVLDHRDSSCTVISLCWSRKRVKETEREKIKEKKQSKTKTNMHEVTCLRRRVLVFVFIPPGRQGLFSNIRRTLAKKPFYCGTVGRLLNERRRK